MLHGVTSIGAYNQPNDQREETEFFNHLFCYQTKLGSAGIQTRDLSHPKRESYP